MFQSFIFIYFRCSPKEWANRNAKNDEDNDKVLKEERDPDNDSD